jgi:RNA polymerase sigma-70 factor, ECF subfamily
VTRLTAEKVPNERSQRGRPPCLVLRRPDDDASDAALASRSIRGDESAFAALYSRYRRTVEGLCVSVLHDSDEAADAAQDAMLRLWQRLPDYRSEAPLRIFISRLCLHVAIDHLRRRQRRPERAVDEGQLARAGDERARPDEELQRRQAGRELSRAFARLGEVQRVVLSLREVDGLSYAQIARALKIPLGTVMSRLFYTRRALRSLLAQGGEARAA